MLTVTDALQPLTPTVTLAPACAPVVDYRWTIKEITGGQQWTMRGDSTADATDEPIVASGTYGAPAIDWNALASPLATYLIQLAITDSCAGIATAVDLVTPATTLKTVIGYSGADVPGTVPPGAGRMVVKAWGGRRWQPIGSGRLLWWCRRVHGRRLCRGPRHPLYRRGRPRRVGARGDWIGLWLWRFQLRRWRPRRRSHRPLSRRRPGAGNRPSPCPDRCRGRWRGRLRRCGAHPWRQRQ